LVDPYQLFVQAPEAIQLMLTQAIFEKLWIMDAEVVGAELTTPFHELLTMEARISKEALSAAKPAVDETAISSQQRRYHRRVGDVDEESSDEGADQIGSSAGAGMSLVERLWIERPAGPLALELKNPAFLFQGRGSNVSHLVGVAVSEFRTSFTGVAGHRSHLEPRVERWVWRSWL
jgi:hypothetical protein